MSEWRHGSSGGPDLTNLAGDILTIGTIPSAVATRPFGRRLRTVRDQATRTDGPGSLPLEACQCQRDICRTGQYKTDGQADFYPRPGGDMQYWVHGKSIGRFSARRLAASFFGDSYFVYDSGPAGPRNGTKLCLSRVLSVRAAEYKILGRDPKISAWRSAVLLSISRSWTALANQLEALTIILKEEGK